MDHRTTSNLEMNELARLRLKDASQKIEEYNCGLKKVPDGWVTNSDRLTPSEFIQPSIQNFLAIYKLSFYNGMIWFYFKWDILSKEKRAS